MTTPTTSTSGSGLATWLGLAWLCFALLLLAACFLQQQNNNNNNNNSSNNNYYYKRQQQLPNGLWQKDNKSEYFSSLFLSFSFLSLSLATTVSAGWLATIASFFLTR
jgi:1,4-dihydroxy-2-naphthoate octaprenyltransferase